MFSDSQNLLNEISWRDERVIKQRYLINGGVLERVKSPPNYWFELVAKNPFMKFSDWQNYSCSQDIAPIIYEGWRSGIIEPWRFFATKQGLERYVQHLMHLGFKKSFLQSQKEFVINTILSEEAAYIKFSQTAIILSRKTHDREYLWDGSGRFQTFSIDNVIQGNILIQVDLAIQIDVTASFHNFEPFLMI